MAGLSEGEYCLHVALLLWAIEAGVRIRDSMTVTQKKAYWVMPSGMKDVPYAPVKSIRKEEKPYNCTDIAIDPFPLRQKSGQK